nr:uncharacterized protein LOC108176527 [Oryctolagus cuniculus]
MPDEKKPCLVRARAAGGGAAGQARARSCEARRAGKPQKAAAAAGAAGSCPGPLRGRSRRVVGRRRSPGTRTGLGGIQTGAACGKSVRQRAGLDAFLPGSRPPPPPPNLRGRRAVLWTPRVGSTAGPGPFLLLTANRKALWHAGSAAEGGREGVPVRHVHLAPQWRFRGTQGLRRAPPATCPRPHTPAFKLDSGDHPPPYSFPPPPPAAMGCAGGECRLTRMGTSWKGWSLEATLKTNDLNARGKDIQTQTLGTQTERQQERAGNFP